MTNKIQQHKLHLIFTSIAGILFILLKTWVSEDAFITARVIDNFVNGYGLVWNFNERVQVYTHPLWMMIHIPFYFLFNDFFYITIFISLSIIFYTLFLMLRNYFQTNNFNIYLLISFLILSRSVSDFYTSGLETPLTFMLTYLFVVEVNKKELNYYIIGLILALLLLNRMDNILLIIPCLIYILASNFKIRKMSKLLIGFLPFLIWIAFSLVYYGFIFPNTKYAKLNTGMDLNEQIEQGIGYFLNLLKYDLTSIIIILITLFLIAIKKNKNLLLNLSLISGTILYTLYAIYVGGDYMIGRFFAPAIFLSIAISSIIMREISINKKYLSIFFAFLLSSFFFSQINIMKSPNVLTKPFDAKYFIDKKTKIHDERGWSWNTNHLIKGQLINRTGNIENHPFAQKGFRLKKKSDSLAKQCKSTPCLYTDYFAIGMTGYYAGINVHLIDNFAIADSFLAHMKMTSPDDWKWAGHYFREIPEGYIKALQKNDYSEMNPQLAEYHKIIKKIISGNIFDEERLSYIIDLNLGKFDYLLEETDRIK